MEAKEESEPAARVDQMSFGENVKSGPVVDRLFYILIGSYLIYILIEGWHRLPGVISN